MKTLYKSVSRRVLIRNMFLITTIVIITIEVLNNNYHSIVKSQLGMVKMKMIILIVLNLQVIYKILCL